MTKFFSLFSFSALIAILLAPSSAQAAEGAMVLNMTGTIYGLLSIAIFVFAYSLVMAEEFIHLPKSKPVMVAAGLIWAIVAIGVSNEGYDSHLVEGAFRHVFLEFAELFIFLLVAMTFINAMTERGVFEALRSWLVAKNFNFRQIFWITGILAFFISPIADNLTTALLMCAVVMAVGSGNIAFVSIACVNIVVAANAGGAFSPFGDITTLMVWQRGVLGFFDFFAIFVPSVVNFLVPAAIMHFAISKEQPSSTAKSVQMKFGAKRIVLLFLLTITLTVSGHQIFHLPPVFGMMLGLGMLGFFGFYLTKKGEKSSYTNSPFSVFSKIARAEWDTLLFFYGVLMCVGGLSVFGYLAVASQFMYIDLGATNANILVGILSAIVDNIPVMFAVLTMGPEMDHGQWLLATLTAGVGGSMLSIGSAAGVALMGQARGIYTFFSHLKWTWAIALGYGASIYIHLLINTRLFDNVPLILK